MPSLVLILPGRLDTLTGGYGYDRAMVAGLRALGWCVIVRELDESFPFPTPAARMHAVQVLADIEDDSLVLMDGLALGALAVEVEREAVRLRLVALVHHPLAAETGLDPAAAAALAASERRALAAVRSVIVTSRATAAALGPYGVPPDRIVVVEPGTDPAPLTRNAPRAPAGSSSSTERQPPSALDPDPLRLLCVASLVPRKGYDVLFRALAATPERHWRLACVGSLDRDPATVALLRAELLAEGLTDRVHLLGEMDGAALEAQYAAADVFVLPTWYEGYGMAVAEAIARGIPVISTPTGAIAELLGIDRVRSVENVTATLGGVAGGPRSLEAPAFAVASMGRDTVVEGQSSDEAAGLLVPAGDIAAWTAALSRVIGDAEHRQQLAAGARRMRDRLPTWTDAAARMALALSAA